MSPKLPLRALLTASHLAVLALPWLALVGTGALAQDLRMQTKAELINEGALVALVIQREMERADVEDPGRMALILNPLVVGVREATLASVRVVGRDGVVVSSSGAGRGEDISHLSEVQEALSGELGDATYPRRPVDAPLSSPTRQADERMSVATPLELDGVVVGAVVLSRTPREELQALYHMSPRLSWGLALNLVVTVGLALGSAWRLSRSLGALAAAGRRLPEQSPELERARGSRVAEVAELAEAVGAQSAVLRQRLRYISDFAGNVSHEFKTPIATLRGTLEILEDDPDMDPEQRRIFLDNAQQELHRLERLVSGLLRLARAEEGSGVKELDLDALAATVADRFEVEFAPGAGRALGNAEQLEAALSNLVENALRHGAPPVRLRAWREGARAGVDVEDRGPGIPEGDRERVFERFFTTARGEGGTGLGLALVRAVARAQGGEAELLESRPGRTVFRLWVSSC